MQEAARELALAKQSQARQDVDLQLLRDELAAAELLRSQAARHAAALEKRLAENVVSRRRVSRDGSHARFMAVNCTAPTVLVTAWNLSFRCSFALCRAAVEQATAAARALAEQLRSTLAGSERRCNELEAKLAERQTAAAWRAEAFRELQASLSPLSCTLQTAAPVEGTVSGSKGMSRFSHVAHVDESANKCDVPSAKRKPGLKHRV